MRFAFPPPLQPAVPIEGSDALFPVHRVYCVGRNYADHAREMGADPNREPPFFFQKNADSLVLPGAPLPYPAGTTDFQHELELVVALGGGGSAVSAAAAPGLIFGYAVGLDMTKRDVQGRLKAKGHPWEVGKAFDASAPIGPIVLAAAVPDIAHAAMALTVNGAIRQTGTPAAMIWSVAELIAHLSTHFTLAPGDVIFTGTPAGVGPVSRGDRIEATISGLPPLMVAVV